MIKYIVTTLILGVICSSFRVVADSKEEIEFKDLDPTMQEIVEDIAAKQASGLEGAKVIVHSVTERSEFYRATPQKNEKLIVVDVTFKDYKFGFGLAGVELIDGREDQAKSYGGEAYQVYLKEDGTLMEDQSGLHLVGPNDTPIRVFLVYSAPKDLDMIGLGYWGEIIVENPFLVQPAPEVNSAEQGVPAKSGRAGG